MTKRIRKAVLPVAGLGTRFLPATKSSPKEMLPVVDKPLVQYAVEEAVDAGIDEIVFVTSRSKRAIEDHFDGCAELEQVLQSQGKHETLSSLRRLLPPHVRYVYVRQPEARGLGHAIGCARALIGDEPFAVILPDDLMDAQPGVLRQMLAQHEATGASIVAVQSVPAEEVSRYGIVRCLEGIGRLLPLTGIVEKPDPAQAPSRLAAVGRYVLTPGLFDCLERIVPGKNGEYQLTDAIAQLCAEDPVYAYRFIGRRFDCGSKLGYLAATIHFALRHPELGEPFRRLLDDTRADVRGAIAEDDVVAAAGRGPSVPSYAG
jgi:UTP--glucose-1-phosphate uridylyltransferase